MNDRIAAVAAAVAAKNYDLIDQEPDNDMLHLSKLLRHYKLRTVSGWEVSPADWVSVKAQEWRSPSVYLYKMYDDNFAKGKPSHVLFMYAQAILRACEDNVYQRDWWTENYLFTSEDLELEMESV